MTKLKKDKLNNIGKKTKLKKNVEKSIKKSPQITKELKRKIKNEIVFKDAKSQNKIAKKTINADELNIDFNQLEKGIEALFSFTEKGMTKKLFNVEKPIFVQITSIKIPAGPTKRIRIVLKHSLVTDKSEICLFVPDLKRGRKVDHEPTVEHYTELLNSHNVNSIKRIIPMRQVKVEYDQFELKRRLFGFYDVFLADSRITGHLSHLLGNQFYNKRKLPVPIRLTNPNLKETVEKALHKTLLTISTSGNTSLVQIGHTEMSQKSIFNNLKVVIAALAKKFPGGWKNVRALHLKTDQSLAIPIYLTLKSANSVPRPRIQVKQPKTGEIVQDELSTFINKDVIVHPSGQVKIIAKGPKKIVQKKQQS